MEGRQGNSFVAQLPSLNQISFVRRLILSNSTNIQVHGFADASERAYGACLYIRSTDDTGNIQIRLLCAKSRVAPIKTRQSIPRLELCAANLLADLFSQVKNILNININESIFWTDSMIVINWIRTSPHLLKTFVANRISNIISKTQSFQWRHVRTYDNPADLLSRGLLPEELVNSHIWREGPVWLSGGEDSWPEQSIDKFTILPEVKVSQCLVTTQRDYTILSKYSTFTRLQRVVATCLRWKFRKYGPLSVDELKRASDKIILLTQGRAFPDEINYLKNGKFVASKSKLFNLNPFLDRSGLVRIRGRLEHADCPYGQKHPLILPKSDHVTTMIIRHNHIKNCHSGPLSTLHSLRENFWIIDGRNQVRKIIRNCTTCSRHRPKPVQYIMCDLPKRRLTEARPFTNVGVDYCGPFFIKEKKFRNTKKIKVFVVIFVCFVIKAVHIELVSDMTTEAFLAALKRFISRRGKCTNIYSDNGTNFVGANNEIKNLVTSQQFNNHVEETLAMDGIKWHFIAPHAPHTGGIWEAAVKSFKHHLKRVVGTQLFTFEQLNTLIIEIEAILNSRPLTPMSSDPNDVTALSPSHFLVGDLLAGIPEQDFSSTPPNRLSAWQHIQKIKRDFWNRWHKEYINQLNIRSKWVSGQHDIKMNSLVLLREDNIAPLHWKLGRVTKADTDPDGVIRRVTVKTANGHEVIRNVKGLAPLLDSQ